MQQRRHVGLLDPGDLGLFRLQITDEHRLQSGQPVGGGDDEADRHRGLLLVRLAPLTDDQGPDPGRIHRLQEAGERLLPGQVVVPVRIDRDAPGSGVRGGPGAPVARVLEVDGRKAAELVQMLRTVHGPELLILERLMSARSIKPH
ncbi:hypothetical protein SCALM49S_03929 [Streptomyces californicus]